MQNCCQDIRARLQNPRWKQLRAECVDFIQACQCFLCRLYGWQAANKYRIHVTYFGEFMGLCIDHDVFASKVVMEQFVFSSASRNHCVNHFKAGIFTTRCFLSISMHSRAASACCSVPWAACFRCTASSPRSVSQGCLDVWILADRRRMFFSAMCSSVLVARVAPSEGNVADTNFQFVSLMLLAIGSQSAFLKGHISLWDDAVSGILNFTCVSTLTVFYLKAFGGLNVAWARQTIPAAHQIWPSIGVHHCRYAFCRFGSLDRCYLVSVFV